MKKFLPLVFFFLPHAHAYEYGFFSGIDGTATFWKFDTDTTFFPNTPSDKSYNNEDWDYSALARFGAYLQWGEDGTWFTAIDFLGEVHDIEFIDNVSHLFGGDNQYFLQITKANYTLGAEVKQGMFLMQHLLGFVTAGLVYTQYKVTTDFMKVTIDSNNVENLSPVSDSEKFYLPGFRFGVGAEQWITPDLSLTARVNYTIYEDKTLNYALEETQFDPSATQLGLGVNFYF